MVLKDKNKLINLACQKIFLNFDDLRKIVIVCNLVKNNPKSQEKTFLKNNLSSILVQREKYNPAHL